MDNSKKPLEELLGSLKEYADIKIDDIKLRTVKGLSLTLNHIVTIVLILFAVAVVLFAAGVGLIILIGSAIGSYAGGAFIVAGIFAILAAILYMLRGKLFLNNFVRMFISIFFDK